MISDLTAKAPSLHRRRWWLSFVAVRAARGTGRAIIHQSGTPANPDLLAGLMTVAVCQFASTMVAGHSEPVASSPAHPGGIRGVRGRRTNQPRASRCRAAGFRSRAPPAALLRLNSRNSGRPRAPRRGGAAHILATEIAMYRLHTCATAVALILSLRPASPIAANAQQLAATPKRRRHPWRPSLSPLNA